MGPADWDTVHSLKLLSAFWGFLDTNGFPLLVWSTFVFLIAYIDLKYPPHPILTQWQPTGHNGNRIWEINVGWIYWATMTWSLCWTRAELLDHIRDGGDAHSICSSCYIPLVCVWPAPYMTLLLMLSICLQCWWACLSCWFWKCSD